MSVQLENISAMDRVEKACQWLCYNYYKRKEQVGTRTESKQQRMRVKLDKRK